MNFYTKSGNLIKKILPYIPKCGLEFSKDDVKNLQKILEAIYLERRKEMAGEGHGFFDLVRTNRAASTIEGFTANKNEVFPIPLIELQLAQAEDRWGNPGY